MPAGVSGYLLVSEGTYGCLGMPNLFLGCLWISVDAYWCLCVPTVV